MHIIMNSHRASSLLLLHVKRSLPSLSVNVPVVGQLSWHHHRCHRKSYASKREDVGQIIAIKRVAQKPPNPAGQQRTTVLDKTQISGTKQLVKAGLPLVLFSVLAAWVVSNAYAGKLREMETAQGRVSKSVRQAILEEEHDEMMERLSKIVANTDFDNTKRIKRPEEVLEERRLARERRNAWHRRLYRWAFRKGDNAE